MIRTGLACVIAVLLVCFAKGQENDDRSRQILQKYPEADLNKDGQLTREEWMQYRAKMRGKKLVKPDRRQTPKSPMRRYRVDEMARLYEAREFQGMPYRLLKPPAQDTRDKGPQEYPLVLSLHGAGGKGNDNLKNLKPWNGVLMEAGFQQRHPCFVVAPQSITAWRVPGSVPELSDDFVDRFPDAWKSFQKGRPLARRDDSKAVLEKIFLLLDQLAEELPIDTDRVYVIGHSMGGMGTFEALAEQPNRFAAAIPSAGGLAPWHDASHFKHVPIWAFHGDEDKTVPIELSQLVFDQMTKVNGNMKLTTLKGVAHGASAFAFAYTGDKMAKGFSTACSGPDCDRTSDVWQWLFNQRRAKQN